MSTIILILLISYLIGSIPFGYLLARYIYGIDIRQHGSGNIGATNVYRTLGKVQGIIVLMLDAGKGVLAVLIARSVAGDDISQVAAAMGVILGHAYPVFLKFKGGKVVATGAGVIFTFSPIAGLIALFLFILSVAVTKYVSVGSMTAAISIPISFYVLDMKLPYLIFAVLVAVFVIYKHHTNIKRLLSGTEHKIK
ncbi:glycerol-3-phosphate 1-O-acyltransferase PlsY [Peptococcaceae bacterium]|nr:glycerol-3-phosphate 1-O-acyltransferase PlsY [Peptococcaceae bacterium]